MRIRERPTVGNVADTLDTERQHHLPTALLNMSSKLVLLMSQVGKRKKNGMTIAMAHAAYAH